MSSSSSVSTAPTIGASALNVPMLVSQLMATEQYPITALQNVTTSYQAKLTAFGQVQSAVSTFQSALQSLTSASSLQANTATASDPTVLSATALTSAAPGSYSLTVGNLAQAQNLVAAGQTSLSTAIGTGATTTLSFDFGTINGTATGGIYGTGTTFTSAGGGIKTVTINSSNNSLQGIRDAINAANIGVSASIVNDGSSTPYRLVLTSANTGAANSMKISASGDATVSSLLSYDPTSTTGQNLNQSLAGLNANITVNGIPTSKASNVVSDIIPGVTINLTKPSTTPVTLTVAPDTATVTKNVNSFVTAYNALSTTLAKMTAYNPSTQTAAILQGNLAILNIKSDLNGILNTQAQGAGSLNSLAQIGINSQPDGTLAVNSGLLATALQSNFKDVAGLFAATGSASDSLVTYNTYTSSTQPGTYPLAISHLATQGSLTGSAAPGLTITAGVNDTINMVVNGTSATLTIPPATYSSAQALASEIQSLLNGSSAMSAAGIGISAGINASGNLSISTNNYGSAYSVGLNGGNGASGLFGSTPVAAAGTDVQGTINGANATGVGQMLTSSSGNSQGLSILVSGGITGARGTVSYSNGYAYTMNNYLTSLLSSSGALTSSTNELNTNISDVAKQIASIQQGLIAKQAMYTAEYTALNNMMTTMTSTSAFLTQQLSKL